MEGGKGRICLIGVCYQTARLAVLPPPALEHGAPLTTVHSPDDIRQKQTIDCQAQILHRTFAETSHNKYGNYPISLQNTRIAIHNDCYATYTLYQLVTQRFPNNSLFLPLLRHLLGRRKTRRQSYPAGWLSLAHHRWPLYAGRSAQSA